MSEAERVAALKARAADVADGNDAAIQKLARDIHSNPELSFSEVQASRWVTNLLRQHGFEIEYEVAALSTAFRASYRGGEGPTIAFLAELDALPGIGHGCGHNLIAPAAAAAAVALKDSWPTFPGRVLVVGTPAEELGGGKILMLEQGVFDDVDLSMMFHPGVDTMVNTPGLADVVLTFSFVGKAAHSAMAPWEGVNAADAAMLFFAGVNALRQHVRPEVRLHGYIKNAGTACNIVPDTSSVEFDVRALRSAEMEAIASRVTDIAHGAAMMTGCALNQSRAKPYLDYRHSESLGTAAASNLERLGFSPKPVGPDTPRGSGDAGNVSHALPHMTFSVSISDERIPGHSTEMRQAAISAKAADAVQVATKTLAFTAIDIFADPALLLRIESEHARAMTSDK